MMTHPLEPLLLTYIRETLMECPASGISLAQLGYCRRLGYNLSDERSMSISISISLSLLCGSRFPNTWAILLSFSQGPGLEEGKQLGLKPVPPWDAGVTVHSFTRCVITLAPTTLGLKKKKKKRSGMFSSDSLKKILPIGEHIFSQNKESKPTSPKPPNYHWTITCKKKLVPT